jgi:hypothetical protein
MTQITYSGRTIVGGAAARMAKDPLVGRPYWERPCGSGASQRSAQLLLVNKQEESMTNRDYEVIPFSRVRSVLGA